MLTESLAAIAEKLIYEDLPDEELRELLLAATPDKVSPSGFSSFVDIARGSVSAEYAPLTELSAVAFDCCGTGGSGLQHFNTSTAVSFVLGAAGVCVVKFGNRAATGSSGSFDLLEQLGLGAPLSADNARRLIENCNQVFLFAPQCYPRLARLAPLRRSLSTRTIFNYIGPALNPAAPLHRLVGVSDKTMQRCLAEYLAREKQTRKALVIRSHDNLDELQVGVLNEIIEINATRLTTADQLFADLPAPLDTLATLDAPDASDAPDAPAGPDLLSKNRSVQGITEKLSPQRNAEIFREVIAGTDSRSRFASLVRLNGGASLYAAGKVETIADGYHAVSELISSGAVQNQFAKVEEAYGRLTD